MLIVISPAKTLDFQTPSTYKLSSLPSFLDDSEQLIKQLRQLSPQRIAKLMKISDELAALNTARFKTWSVPFNKKNAKAAVLAFKGDVYQGLQAESFAPEEAKFAQNRLRILSGLYGVLKPFDLIQPYRLEMGTALTTKRGKNLYQFWHNSLIDKLNSELKTKHRALINLASIEYFKVLAADKAVKPTITPVFKEYKNGQYKIISFYAKKARGMMARFIIRNRLSDPEDIKKFDAEGYAFNQSLSVGNTWVFSRRI